MIDRKLLDEYQVLSNIKRFNNTIRHHEESVAEHSFYVSLYVLEICKKYNLSQNITTCSVIKSIIHDVSESVLTDIPHNIKANFPIVKEHFEMLEKEYNKRFEYLFSSYKEEEMIISDLVVKAADILSVLYYSEVEYKIGNEHFTDILQNTKERLNIEKEKLEREIYKYAI